MTERKRGIGSVAAVTATLIVLLFVRTRRQWTEFEFLERGITVALWIASVVVSGAIGVALWRHWRLRRQLGR